jgi:hypothetical protein
MVKELWHQQKIVGKVSQYTIKSSFVAKTYRDADFITRATTFLLVERCILVVIPLGRATRAGIARGFGHDLHGGCKERMKQCKKIK